MTVHSQRFRVRYGETDQMGYVHHSVYLLYFEEGRTGFLRDLGSSYAKMESAGHLLPVVDAGLRYRSPARFDEELITETRVTEVTGARVRFDYRVLHATDGTPAAEGFTVLASCGADGKPKRLSPEASELLRSVLEPMAGNGVRGGAAGSGAPSSKG